MKRITTSVALVDPKEMASQALTKALTFQSPVARKNLERLRRVHPDETPTELAKRVTWHYLSLVTIFWGRNGRSGGDSRWWYPICGLRMSSFTEASVLYALTLAEIHGIHPEDIERRRLLVQTVLIGDAAINGAEQGRASKNRPLLGKADRQRGSLGPRSSRRTRSLGSWFITKYGTKQGVLVLSKQIPLGIGIGVGAGASLLIAGRSLAPRGRSSGPRRNSSSLGRIHWWSTPTGSRPPRESRDRRQPTALNNWVPTPRSTPHPAGWPGAT